MLRSITNSFKSTLAPRPLTLFPTPAVVTCSQCQLRKTFTSFSASKASSDRPKPQLHKQSKISELRIRGAGRRYFSSEDDFGFGKKEKIEISDEYIPFQDRKRIIQDVIDREWNPVPEWTEEPIVTTPVNLERGKTGVFDLDELVDLLKLEHGYDVCVIALPKEIKYVDHMVIVTARSPKHAYALSTLIRKRFKMKHLKSSDIIPKLEGITKRSSDWIALDLGNIVLHVFTQKLREEFDLETLWTVGPQFDDMYNQKDSEIVQLLNLSLDDPIDPVENIKKQ